MKSKQEILNSYYAAGSDGNPEISAEDLLNAMEAYKDQHAEAAFNAARSLNQNTYEFATYTDYVNHTLLTAQKEQENRNHLDEAITLVANSILPNFLPHDNTVGELSFSFPMRGINYTAFYTKDAKGYWQLSNWQ
ncbi:hypothetical protein [Mucilaginibacter sp. SP1R1]|uniref:hypothetical protein n=1 Tax=Mucilaginibacter sp. SP1R1 TaxID=2723091 RepID=UPI00161FAF1A|nr:hypothetical protein [Mucilaginibacter sp. SP1R1]MBB6150639.1 hypothetical protein [Mucilaginibacter sp. SP1R1]